MTGTPRSYELAEKHTDEDDAKSEISELRRFVKKEVELLAMIGEQFDHGDEICGAVVNIRVKQEKISIWIKNGLNEATQVSIGKQWKKFLDYGDSIGFILHDDAKKLERAAKNRYTV